MEDTTQLPLVLISVIQDYSRECHYKVELEKFVEKKKKTVKYEVSKFNSVIITTHVFHEYSYGTTHWLNIHYYDECWKIRPWALDISHRYSQTIKSIF
jgi:hypothetical protein